METIRARSERWCETDCERSFACHLQCLSFLSNFTRSFPMAASEEDALARAPAGDPDAAWLAVRATQRFEPVESNPRVRFVWPPVEVLAEPDNPVRRRSRLEESAGAPPEELPPRGERATRFVVMSDTHTMHEKGLSAGRVPRGDVFLHCGDFTNKGSLADVEAFARWVRALPHPEKVVIAGNHDLLLDPAWPKPGKWGRPQSATDRERALAALREACVYLDESAYVTRRGGHRLFGSPWSPTFCDWAFNADRGHECRARWDRVPDACDVLLTHGPPLGRGDLCSGGNRAGCVDLLRTVQRRVRPAVSVAGHIHEGFGASFDGTTTYLNASSLDLRYRPVHPAVVFDLAW